jgi:hypothetical protein
MAGVGVQGLVAMRHCSSLEPPARGVLFAYYVVVGLVPPVSPFLLRVLEFYGVQLQHLSPHSFILVAIFIHFYGMFIGVRPSIPIFRLFHMLHWAGKGTNLIGTYYF